MKLLFYSPVQLPAGGGCERWHCDVTASLKNKFGDHVEIVTGNLGTPRWTDDYLTSQLAGTAYTRLQFPIFFSSIFPDPISVWRLGRKISAADAVHFITGFVGQDIMMAVLKLITGKRMIVGHHAPIFHFSKFHNWYIKNISRHLYKLFDAHMALNRSDKKILEEWGIANVHFIPSGVRVEKFLRLPRRSHPKLNFLSVGRYDTPQKGFDLAIQAIGEFNRLHPKNHAVFQFAGSASAPTIVEQAASTTPNIINHGYVPYEKIPALYQNSDVFLLSSREEPFGLILIEAWSSGMPILATQTEGPRDMLRPGKNGWFVDSISAQGILSGIERIYRLWADRPAQLIDMAPACRQTGKKFSIDTTAARMRELLQS